jgi:hypothetical protein
VGGFVGDGGGGEGGAYYGSFLRVERRKASFDNGETNLVVSKLQGFQFCGK